MRFKPGISIEGIKPELLAGLMVADDIFHREFKAEMTITAVTDGKHMTNSKHYTGHAVDIRTRDLSRPEAILSRLNQELDEWYDIVMESDHIHFEYDTHK